MKKPPDGGVGWFLQVGGLSPDSIDHQKLVEAEATDLQA
jgi:hypothetical protein